MQALDTNEFMKECYVQEVDEDGWMKVDELNIVYRHDGRAPDNLTSLRMMMITNPVANEV